MPRIHDLTATDIDGKPVDLASKKGKVLLFVNVASKCGFTPQYADLERLHQKYKDRGFEILGFPSNDFMWQERGSDAEIKAFCTTKYQVTFPMFSKIEVKGKGKSPVYGVLSEKFGEPKWNFHKYLVGKDGEVLNGYKSAVEPLDAALSADIEKALAA